MLFKYTLVVFDMDGTIADTKEDLGRAYSMALCSAGFKKPDGEEIKSAIGRGAVKALQKLSGAGEESALRMAEEFSRKYEEICCDNIKLYPCVREMLHGLKQKGVKLALVTMKYHGAAVKIARALNIDIFDSLVAFDDTEKRKPDPQSLYMLMDRFGAKKENTLVVGDSEVDVLYAKTAGADVCVMKHGYGDMKAAQALKPDFMLDGFSELMRLAGI